MILFIYLFFAMETSGFAEHLAELPKALCISYLKNKELC